MAKELNKKATSLIKAIKITIEASIFTVRLYLKLILGFEKYCKDAKMRAKKLKKIWKKEKIEKNLIKI